MVIYICKSPFFVHQFQGSKPYFWPKCPFRRDRLFITLIHEFSEFENFSIVMRNFSGFLILASICLILSSIFTTSFCKSAISFLSLSLTAFGDSLSSSAYFSAKLSIFLCFCVFWPSSSCFSTVASYIFLFAYSLMSSTKLVKSYFWLIRPNSS